MCVGRLPVANVPCERDHFCICMQNVRRRAPWISEHVDVSKLMCVPVVLLWTRPLCTFLYLHAERKKESTLGVSMVSQQQRSQSGNEFTGSGATLYDYEYDLSRWVWKVWGAGSLAARIRGDLV